MESLAITVAKKPWNFRTVLHFNFYATESSIEEKDINGIPKGIAPTELVLTKNFNI